MTTKQIEPIAVRILGKEYAVACPKGEEDALLSSAAYVDEEMRRIRDTGKVLDTNRIAVMVALNLAHDLLNKQGKQNISSESLGQLQVLQERLEAALDKHNIE